MPATTDAAELFDPAFLERLRSLLFQLRRRRILQKRGGQATPATGFTRDFKDYRHYAVGDDYRGIDWRLYARMGRLFVRLFEEVQELHVHVIVDVSGSMSRPHAEKRHLALRLAVALSYLGLVSRHPVSLFSLGAKMERRLPPLTGPGNIRRVTECLSTMSFGGTTDLAGSFRSFNPGRQRGGIYFVLSDLFGSSPEAVDAALPRLSLWPGEVHLIHLFHPQERSPRVSGELALRDAESGAVRRLLFSSREAERYVAAFDSFCERLRRQCVARQIDYVPWETDRPFEDTFIQLLRRGTALAQ